MYKKIFSMAIPVILTTAATTSIAFAAANPFSDVPSDSWAYDAVSQLAKDGVIDGATLRYRPYVSIACDGADAASDLYFTIKNTGSEGFDARAEVVVNGIAYEIDSFYCAAGAERQVKLHIFDSLGIDASEIEAVRISFQNVYTDSSGTQEMFADRVFELSDIFFDKR